MGDDIRAAEKDLYMELIDEVAPLPKARDLIEVLKERGHAVVLASSAKSHEVDHYLDLLDARRWLTAGPPPQTSSARNRTPTWSPRPRRRPAAGMQ